MPYFSERSNSILETVHPDLQYLFKRVVLLFDCTVLPDGGRRTAKRQAELVAERASKALQSKHLDGKAVDVAPYWPDAPHVRWPSVPVDDDDLEYWTMGDFEEWKVWMEFIGYTKGIARELGIEVINGVRWEHGHYAERPWIDAPHWELK